MNNKYSFEFEILNSSEELPAADAALLQQARTLTQQSYAPYSNFHVAAVAQLVNGAVVTGTNQENASYPVSICAERSLLSTAAALHPEVAIETMAITYHNQHGSSNKPVSPCGMCRQALLEFSLRTQHPIKLILSGMEGPVYVIEKNSQLLPLSFTKDDFK